MEFLAITEKNGALSHKVFSSQVDAESYLNRPTDSDFSEAVGIYNITDDFILPASSYDFLYQDSDTSSGSLDSEKNAMIVGYLQDIGTSIISNTPYAQLTQAKLKAQPMFDKTHTIFDVRAVNPEGSLTVIFSPVDKNFPLENTIAHLHLKKGTYGNFLPIYLIKTTTREKNNKNNEHIYTSIVPIDDVYAYFQLSEFVFSGNELSSYRTAENFNTNESI